MCGVCGVCRTRGAPPLLQCLVARVGPLTGGALDLWCPSRGFWVKIVILLVTCLFTKKCGRSLLRLRTQGGLSKAGVLKGYTGAPQPTVLNSNGTPPKPASSDTDDSVKK